MTLGYPSWLHASDNARGYADDASASTLETHDPDEIAGLWSLAAEAWDVAADAAEEANLAERAEQARASAASSRANAKHAFTHPFLMFGGYLTRDLRFHGDVSYGRSRHTPKQMLDFVRRSLPAQQVDVNDDGRSIDLLVDTTIDVDDPSVERLDVMRIYGAPADLRVLKRALNRGTSFRRRRRT